MVNQRISYIWIIIFLMMIGIAAILPAADFTIDNGAGDWLNPDTGTLAEALQDPTLDDESTITFTEDIDSGWTNWQTKDGYTIFTAPPLQISGGTLMFDLGENEISGADLDIVTGNAIFHFMDGILGTDTTDFGIGVNGDATVTLENIEVLVKNLKIGSESSKGVLDLQSSIVTSTELHVIGPDSKLTLDGDASINTTDFSILDGGTVDSYGEITVDNLLRVDGYGSSLIMNADGSTLTLSVTNGGAVTINADFDVSGNLTVSGVGIEETTSGNTFLRSALSGESGEGALSVTGDITIDGGADVDFSTLLPSFTATTTQSLTIDGVFFDKLSGTNYQTTVAMDGDLTTVGGTIEVTGGAKLSGVDNIFVNGGSLSVKGTDGKNYRSEVAGSGALMISGGTVNVQDGGLIGGRTNIIVGDGSDGTLNIEKMDAATNNRSMVNSNGTLIVGNDAIGTLKIMTGGVLTASETIIGQGSGADGSSVTISGSGTGNNVSSLTISGDLYLSESANATMSVQGGGQVTVTGNSYIGNTLGKMATLTLADRGGTGATDATLNTTGTVYVGYGEEAIVNLTINPGGNVTSGSQTILGYGKDSEVTVSITSDHYRSAWNAGTGGAAPVLPGSGAGQYGSFLPQGNAKLDVVGGIVSVRNLFAMAGQYDDYASGYGTATFTGGGELHMNGGSFYNMNTNDFETDSLGLITIGSGGIVSGSGYIYAGEQFIVNGGTIAPGSRGMYDFNRLDNDKLQSLGTLHIYDRNDMDTLFHGATFRTELDRGTAPNNTDGLSDRAIVYGDLNIDAGFTVDFSRPLDGKYLLIQTQDGGKINSDFTERSLKGLGDVGLLLNLNGKNIEGNKRIDYSNSGAGGAYTTLENFDTAIWLTIKTTSQGNVITYWTGDATGNNEWNMRATSFEARETNNITKKRSFTNNTNYNSGENQFLDGDIVYFDYEFVTGAAQRIVNVTGNDIGDGFYLWNGQPNVRVAEVNVISGTGSDVFVWKGDSIFALDSALYSTLDQITNGKTPSGRFNKIGEGVLEIWNANEFYGGIHLGESGVGGTTGTLGGLIQLYNEKGLGTYNSATGFQEKGLVHVHENSVIQLMYDDMEINNRFIVDPGKILTFMFEGSLTIKDNNALHSTDDSTRQGRGGGVFIGDDGQIVYEGTGQLILRNNKAKAGGGIYTQLGYTLQVPAYIYNNYADGPGGGIYAERYFALKDGSDISGNAAQSNGGGIYVGNTGRLLNPNDKYFVLHGNTQVVNNKSGGETGGGIYVDAGRVLQIQTGQDVADGVTFNGGDVWFEGNYAKVGFDPDNPTDPDEMDVDNAIRNAIHLSNKATVGTAAGAELQIFGPYNTYFYDPVSGDVGTTITIQGVQADNTPGSENNNHGLLDAQYGTVIFRDDSEFYGDTEVVSLHKNDKDEWLGGATFRLEIDDDDAEAIYGRRGSQEGKSNTFMLGTGAWITGQGTIAADNIILQGNLDLDTGTFSKDPYKAGGGVVDTPKTIGTLNLDGEVTIEDTSKWYLTIGTGGMTDKVNVTGTATFTGTTAGERMTFYVDDIFRTKYAVLTASGGITKYAKDDAPIMYYLNDTWVDLVCGKAPDSTDPHFNLFGRMRATSYVEDESDTLYLDIGGRNRHVKLMDDSDWGYNPAWTFTDVLGIPTPTGTVDAGNWEKNDEGPETNVYLDGDMVTISGATAARTVELTTNVRPVDLFVDGTHNVRIEGSSGITTYSTTAVADRNTTTITTNAANNDYGIPGYTGKLYKTGTNTLTFATGANLFTEGIVFDISSGNAGVISFSDGNQLRVGSGRWIDFIENGTLNATASTILATAIQVQSTKTGTFDITNNSVVLTQFGVISQGGAIEKIGTGTLALWAANTFTGGTTFRAGTIEIRHNQALGQYVTSLGTAGSVYVRENVTKKLLVNNNDYIIRNRFDVSGGTVANVLSIDIASGRIFTIDNGNLATLANGGAIYVATGQGQLTFGDTGDFTISNNRAQSGGGIYSGVNSLLTFTGATSFISNTATVGSGGGLYNADAVTFNGETTIQSNVATSGSGGGVYATGNVTLNNNGDFTLGDAGSLGNTAYLDGGGIYSGGNVTLNGTGTKTIAGNQSTTGSGGAIYAGTGITVTGAVTLGTASSGNRAGTSGGALYALGAVDLQGTGTKSIVGNTAGTSGGGIYATGNVTFGNGATTLTGNSAGASGGVIWSGGTVDFQGTAAKNISGNSAMGGSGGAVFAQNIIVNGTATITGNTAASGGAFYVDGDTLTLMPTLATNTITFQNNIAGINGSGGSAAYLTDNASIVIGGLGNVIFNDTIVTSETDMHTFTKNGTGTVMFAGGKSSTFNGDTTIDGGTFRITQGTTYGAFLGSTGTFLLEKNPANSIWLTGGGTLAASAFDLYGTVAPDKNITATSVPTSIPDIDLIGTLTFQGAGGGDTVVTMYGNNDPLSYQYEAHLAAGTTADDPNAWKTTGQSDLLSIGGTFYAEIGTNPSIDNPEKIVINIHNFGVGKYRLIEATDLLVTRDGIPEAIDDHDLDGIGDAAGAFTLLVHTVEKTNRHLVLFLRGTEQIDSPDGLSNSVYANDAYNQYVDEHDKDPGNPEYDKLFAKAQNELWLATQTYNLLMYWTGKNDGDGLTNLWQGTDSEASGNWREEMFSHSLEPETHFMHADSVVFAETYPDYSEIPGFTDSVPITVRGITIEPTGVRVTNMLVDNLAGAANTYSFSGGGITTTPNYAGDELDDLLGYMPGNAPQQLVKKNTGTLTFTNAANTFASGIVFETSGAANAGIITFTNDNQLRSWATAQNIDDNGITFNQTGTIQLNRPGTTANSQTLSNNIVLNATGNFYTQADTLTLSGLISGTGALTKVLPAAGTTGGTLILTNSGNTYTGTTTVDTGTLQANGVGTLGENVAGHLITNNATLDVQIATGSETLYQTIGGTGTLLKSGNGNLTLDNTNTYTGNTTITGTGTLIAKGIAALGTDAAGKQVSSTTGGTFNLELASAGTLLQELTGTNLNFTKSGAATLTISRVNTYTGITKIDDGRIVLTNVAGLGINAAAQHVIIASGTFLEMNATGTFSKSIDGAGELIVSGGALTLNTVNNFLASFTGGTTFSGGSMTLTNASALNTYTTPGGTKGNVDVTGTGTTKTVTLGATGPFQNRFHVIDGTLVVNTTTNTTISGVNNGAGLGGAFLVDAGNTLQLNNANAITFTNNTGSSVGNDVYLSNAMMNIAGSGSTFFNSGIAGTGTISKTSAGIVQIAENSAFDGTTTVSAGTFRIVGGKTFGSETANFTLGAGAILAGQGTIKAAQISLAGTVSPDSATFVAGESTTIPTMNRFGTITVDGEVALANTFVFNYNSGTPVASTTVTPVGYNTSTGDLIKMQNGGAGNYTINNGATVNFVDTLTTGKHLIFIADEDFTLVGGMTLDGIKAGGVVKATGSLDTHTPRGGFQFVWGTSTVSDDVPTNDIESQIWLDVNRNTLEMTWQDTSENTEWVSGSGGANFLSTQVNGGTKEQMFNDGDYVIFGTTTTAPTTRTITIGNDVDTDGVIVSGMKVTANTDYTFTGDGITALTVPHETIEGDYIPGGVYHSGTTPVNPDGKLQKSGAGTLTFANGVNVFTEGIDIGGGTVGFSNGNQLQVGSGKAITFSGGAANNAKLQANASTTLATNVIVTTGNKGTIDTLTNKLTNTGSFDIAGGGAIEWATESGGFLFQNNAITGTGTVTKTGAGTVQIGTDSAFNGATTVSGGTFRVVDNKTFGGTATSFTAEAGTTVAGGGTIRADGITIRGIISPDSDTLDEDNLIVDGAHQFGILTFDGFVTLDGFTMTYHESTPKTTKEATANITTGDLLRILSTDAPLLKAGTIDIQEVSLNTGWYLIAESETAFELDGKTLDGITGGGVLNLTRFGQPINTESPRHWYEFEFGDNAEGVANTRIWLLSNTNSLIMDWQGDNGHWEAMSMDDTHWKSQQNNSGVHSLRFREGDYAKFNVTAHSEIDIVDDAIIVSGLKVDGTFNTTFIGDGGVHAKTTDSTWIIGKYLPGGIGYVDPDKLDPDGKLQKTGAGVLTFENTGGNLFEEGIDIAAGTVGFNRGNQLQVGSGKAITFTGIADNNARLQANDTITLATDIIVAAGNKGTIDTLANSLTHTGGIATVGNGEIELATATGGFLFQNGAVTGTGTVTKTGAGTVQIGANSAFSGVTTVSGGTFRVAQGISYGTTGSGSDSFTAGVGTTVAGGGTIRATEITLAGIVTPDSEVFATGSTAVLPANRFGTLTLDGKVNLASTFNFNYNAGTPVASTTVTPVGYNMSTGDLIKMQNGGASGYTIHDGATVNFVDVLVSGKYLIFTADRDFTLVGGTGELDGIKAGGVSKATFEAVENQTPRGNFEFIWGTSAPGTNDIKSQIWLDVDRNTLEMTWQDTPESSIWVSAAGDANFLSTQKGIDGITQEQMFNDGDYVIFKTTTTAPTARSITIGTGGVIVSGMNVDANSNYTFTGNGITALTAHETIEGDYIPGGASHSGTTPVNPDGKLQKSGTGMLTFSNGVNRFTKGIEISDGTIAFSNANQLNTLDVDPGNTDRGITFLGSGTLRSNANIPSLANNIKLSNLVTATFDTNGYNMTLNSKIDDLAGTGNVTKDGLGMLTLMNTTNDWNGTTDVKSGTLLAIGVETLGNNVSSRTITVESGADLTLQIAAAETLRQELRGGGEVRKTGVGDLIFNTDSPNFAGRFNFVEGNVYLNGTDFHNSDSFRVGTGVTLFGTGFLGSGGIEGGVIQAGAKLIPNGVVANDPGIPPVATTLNISGNLSFDKGSLYQVVITQYTDPTYDLDNLDRMRPVNDMIIVDSGGIVKIDKDAELNVLIDYWSDTLAPTDFGATTSGRFTIIDATGGFVDDQTAQFVMLEAELPRGVEFTHGWVDSLYQLWFVGDPSGMFGANGITRNQKEIGRLLDYLMETKDPGMQELLRILSQREITDDMLGDILGQMTGDLRANSIGMALKMPWRHPFNRIDRDMFPRLFDPCQPITCRPEYKYTREFWAEGYGSFSNTRSDGNTYANTVRRLGMAVGFDQRICDYSLIGAVFNYSKPILYQDTGRAEADDYEIGIYNLTKITGTVDLKSYFGYSHQEYDLRRHVFIPAGARYDAVYDSYRSKTGGDSFAMSFELLRPMDYNDYVTFAPLIALDYNQVWQKGYSESGGLTALRYDNATLERLMLRFGVNTKVFSSNRFDMHTRIQYAMQLNHTEYPRSGTHFVNAMVGGAPIANIRGSSIGRDHLNIGMGGEYYLNRKRSMSVHLGYDTDLWKRMSIHTGNLGYTHRW